MSSPTRSRIAAWASWDCGATGMSAIVTTFVFSVYLTGSVGVHVPGQPSPASWLGRALALAGFVVAVLAPVTGVLVQAASRRRTALTLLTLSAATLTAAMSLIRPHPSYLFAGLALLAATAACLDLATVPYNAMLRQLSTPLTSGRISGFGAAAGYFGSVLLLLVVYFGFVVGSGPHRGLLGIAADDGQNVRAAMLLTAAWLLIFATPLMFTAHRIGTPDAVPAERIGLMGAYRKVWADLIAEWRRDRNLVYYLMSSAIFRDGLTGVFAFGAVLGVSVYGLSQADVLLFGVAACVVAAAGAVVGGHVDDRVGSKPVIVTSLISMMVIGLILLTLSGSIAFWVCGLLLCLFVGPTHSAARTMLLRMCAHGREGVAFGLYTMTGRAATFLAPWMFFTFVDAFGTDRAGLAGLLVVLGTGLIAVLWVRSPARLPADR
ncbi:MAG: MFS transporter [Mycobacterium sp.]